MMLSESVLDELVRSTSFQPDLIALAWPSLSVESKLQLVQSLQGNGIGASTPDWLLHLAMADDAAIVRYWAARRGDFKKPVASDQKNFGYPPTEEDLLLTDHASNDPEPMVQACVDRPSGTFRFDWLSELSQSKRLHALRNLNHADVEGFIDWLETAIASAMPSNEILDCIIEFFALPNVKEDLARSETEQDGFHVYRLERAMEKAWNLLKIAPKEMQCHLPFYLPVKIGEHTPLKVEIMVTLPEPVLDTLIYTPTFKSTDEIEKLKQLILDKPEQFPPKVVENLREMLDNGYMQEGAEDIRRITQTQRLDASKAILEELFHLRDQAATLEERLVDVEHAVQSRKGLIF